MARSRQEVISTFKSHGYDFINNNNLDGVLAFLEDLRGAGNDAQYGSKYMLMRMQELYEDTSLIYGEEETSKAFNRAGKRGLSPDQLAGNVKEWIANAEEVQQGRRSGKLRVYSKYSNDNYFYDPNFIEDFT